jgi:Heterokaryon incompatibility protein (HET)
VNGDSVEKSANDSPSRYRPLKETEIRYLIIHPYRESVGLVECSLHYAPIGSAGYSAISYAWGDANNKEVILVDNRPFQITANLASCLKTLNIIGPAKWGLPSNTPLHLWVDAICINQDDIPERNRQVLRMHDIYKGARNVQIWLGPKTAHTELAFNRLREIDRAFLRLPQGPSSAMLGQLTEISRKLLPGLFLERLDNDLEQATHEGLKDLVNRSWWRRTWILQEVAAQAEPVFLCGEHRVFRSSFLNYNQLFGIAAVNSGANGIIETQSVENDSVSSAVNIHRDVLNAKYSTLLQLLRTHRNKEATDPKDKVYGIIGLSSDFSSGTYLEPNYELSVREVYASVVKAHIENYDNLDILGHCGYPRRDPDLPSWVPDWRITPAVIGYPLEKTMETSDGGMQRAYRASGETVSFGDHPPKVKVTDKHLVLHGFHLDVIDRLSAAADYTDPTPVDVETSWAPENKTAVYHPTGETMEKAYLRTIVADLNSLAIGPRTRPFAMFAQGESVNTANEVQSTDPMHARYAKAALMKVCHRRRLAYTRREWMGVVPEVTQVGDVVAVLVGGQMLYVLRRGGGSMEERYQLVGEAYFHGMMDGEAVRVVGGWEGGIEKIVLE